MLLLFVVAVPLIFIDEDNNKSGVVIFEDKEEFGLRRIFDDEVLLLDVTFAENGLVDEGIGFVVVVSISIVELITLLFFSSCLLMGVLDLVGLLFVVVIFDDESDEFGLFTVVGVPLLEVLLFEDNVAD